MGERRTLEFDPLTGVKTDFVWEPGSSSSEDGFAIQTTQDVTAIIESNKKQLFSVDRHQPHGEWSKVASLPLTVYHQLKTEGVIDDPKRFKKWLNDKDNRYFRTRQGKI